MSCTACRIKELTVDFLNPQIAMKSGHSSLPHRHAFCVLLPLCLDVLAAVLVQWRSFVWQCFECFATTVSDCRWHLISVLGMFQLLIGKQWMSILLWSQVSPFLAWIALDSFMTYVWHDQGNGQHPATVASHPFDSYWTSQGQQLLANALFDSYLPWCSRSSPIAGHFHGFQMIRTF